MIGVLQSYAEYAVRDMMIEAGRNNRRSVIEFILWESGVYYMELAQLYANDAFEAAIEGGNVKLMDFLRGNDDAGHHVAPGLDLTKLSWATLEQAIKLNRNWSGIKHLVNLKTKGDRSFANFELDRDTIALCMAYEVGNYDVFECLRRNNNDGGFVFPRTNPVAKNNKPLVNACSGGHLDVMKFPLRMKDGKYVLPGMNSVGLVGVVLAAIEWNQKHMLEWLSYMNKFGEHVLYGTNSIDFTLVLTTMIKSKQKDSLKCLLSISEGGEYVLPGMNGVDFTRVVSTAIEWEQRDIVEWLLEIEKGRYVLPGMNSVDFTRVLSAAIEWNQRDTVQWLLSMKNFGEYVLPGMNGVDFTRVLSVAIKRSWNSKVLNIVKFLLSKSQNGRYLLPGVKVTEEMRRIKDQSPEMRDLLEMHLGPQHPKA